MKCTKWCIDRGLFRSAPLCCNKSRKLCFRNDRGICDWYCGKCRTRCSVLRDSVLERAKISLQHLLLLVACFVEKLTYEQTVWACQTDDGVVISHQTIAHYFRMFRQAIINGCPEFTAKGGSRIGGPGRVVQIDEAQIGRRKYHVGRVHDHLWVIGMVDDQGETRMVVCPENRRDLRTIHEIIGQFVEKDSTIVTDGWAAYRGIEKCGYADHLIVNHTERFVDPLGHHTQRAESRWRELRRLLHPGGRRKERIDDHLVEFLWRRHCKTRRLDTFMQLISLLV